MKITIIKILWLTRKGIMKGSGSTIRIQTGKVFSEGGVHSQYQRFCEVYSTGVLGHVSPQTDKTKRIKHWFNDVCVKAKEDKYSLGNRCRRHRSDQAYGRYKPVRNEYSKVRREAQPNNEKDITDRSKDQPKLFCSYIESKSEVKDETETISDDGIRL